MRSLLDYMVVKTPLIALIDRDQRWSRAVVADVIEALGGAVGVVMEWNMGVGWKGPEGVVSQSGLTRLATGLKDNTNPAVYLAELLAWLAPTTSDQPGEDRRFPFRSGVAMVSDIEQSLETPLMYRVLMGLPEMLARHRGTCILLLSDPLPPRHPLHSAVIQVEAGGGPADRFGRFVRTFLDEYKYSSDPETVESVAAPLAGLTMTQAETVLRFVALDLVEEDTPILAKFLPDAIARVRKTVEFPAPVP